MGYLDAIKGWPRDSAIDVVTRFSTAAKATAASGMVAHIDANGEYSLGIGNLIKMPLLLWSAPYDKDVEQSGLRTPAQGPSVQYDVTVPVVPGTGAAMALVCNGAYELVSDQYVGSTPDFLYNQVVGSATSGGNAGKLIPVSTGNTVVGLVSRGLITWNTVGAVAFWTNPIFKF